MTGQREFVVARWVGSSAQDGLATLLAAYHLRTEAEKGAAVADVDGLPERYRKEVLDPRGAFAGDTVLVATAGDVTAGCLVMTGPVDGQVEIKRLWTEPAFRGRGVAGGLLEAALGHAAEREAHTVRLSVWEWRAAAIALYARFGFVVTRSWDERDRLVCMTRAI